MAVGVNEAAEMIGVSPQLIRLWCTNNVLPYLRVGNKFLVRVDTLSEFLRLNEGNDLKQFSNLSKPGCVAAK